MKTLKQIREEYDNIVLDQVQVAPDELMLEGRENAVMRQHPKAIPNTSEMPAMLMFRRIAYRMYPNKQVVALYYSKFVNKYLSIPFGPDGNLNLSEAIVHDEMELDEGVVRDVLTHAAAGHILGATAGLPGATVGTLAGAGYGAYKAYKKSKDKKEKKDMNEDWQDVNRKDKTDGLSQKAVNAYRREHPGSKLKTAVTEKNPTGKRASRRKSFCSRMGGMKKRLTSAKTARDPDSRINKALRRWNCEESFKQKLHEMRLQREGVRDVLDAGAEAVVPYYSAGKKVYKGDYAGAAKDAAVDTALLATGAIAGKALGAGYRGLSKLASRFKKAKATPRDASAMAKSSSKSSGRKALAGAAAGGAAADALLNKKDSQPPASSSADDAVKPHEVKTGVGKSTVKAKSSRDLSSRSGMTPTHQSKYEAGMLNMKENKIADIQNMINENVETMNMVINGRTVTLNNSMAKRILEVYDSVNTKNKKIVESMLNEDLESFKKLLNFSIKV